MNEIKCYCFNKITWKYNWLLQYVGVILFFWSFRGVFVDLDYFLKLFLWKSFYIFHSTYKYIRIGGFHMVNTRSTPSMSISTELREYFTNLVKSLATNLDMIKMLEKFKGEIVEKIEVKLKLGSHRGDDRCRPTSSPTTSLVRMHGIRRPSSQNGRRTAKRLGDEYQNFLILVAQDSSLKATAIIAVGGNQA